MDYIPENPEALGGLYYINFGKVVDHVGFSSVTRLLAARLQREPYLTLGDFFKSLNNMDLDVLGGLVDKAMGDGAEIRGGAPERDSAAMEELLLISQMLTRAEGTETANMDEISKQVEYFVQAITLVALERKGLIRVYYENMTFEKNDKPLAEKL